MHLVSKPTWVVGLRAYFKSSATNGRFLGFLTVAVLETSTPPASAKASIRAAMLTPSP
jgi:hypothetical protein